MPRRSSGPSSTRATSLQQHRRAVVGLQHDVRDIGDALEVAAAADDEFEFGELDGAAADIGVAGADGVAQLLTGDAQGAQPAADRRRRCTA